MNNKENHYWNAIAFSMMVFYLELKKNEIIVLTILFVKVYVKK